MYFKQCMGTLMITKSENSSIRIEYGSRLWRIWRVIITPGTCYYCASMNGRILSVDDPRIEGIPVHENCRCCVEAVTAIAAGTATNAGAEGVDLYVALHGSLPAQYLVVCYI